MLRKLVDCWLELGQLGKAEDWARESLGLLEQTRDRQMMVFALSRVARIAAESGRLEEAGYYWGAIEAEEERSSMRAWAKERERLAAPVLAHAGPEFEEGRAQGREVGLDGAVERALGRSERV
jgi:hypothetical protein